MSGSWVQDVISGVIAGTVYATASYQYRKRGLIWSRRQAAEIRALAENATAVSEQSAATAKATQAAHGQVSELLQRLQRLNARSARATNFNVLLLAASGYLSSCHSLESAMTRREPDIEQCRAGRAEIEENHRLLCSRSESARASVPAGRDAGIDADADAEREVAALDGLESAAAALHGAMTGWYEQAENAGWPAGRRSPDGLWPARQALYHASQELAGIADGYGSPAADEAPAAPAASAANP